MTSWLPAAIAASVLIAIAGSSFFYFTRIQERNIASNPTHPPLATKRGAEDPSWAKWLPFEGSPLPSAPMPAESKAGGELDFVPRVVNPSLDRVALAPPPHEGQRDLLGSNPHPQLPRFDSVEIRIPFLKPLADFDRDSVRQQLADELREDPAFRIDLFTRNLNRAVDLFHQAAKGTRLVVHIDKATLNYLRKGQLTSVAIYSDSLSADELTSLVTRLNSEDANVSPRVFDTVHVVPIGREDEVDIRRVLGIDPGLFKRAFSPAKNPKEFDKSKSISAGTAEEIIKSIGEGKGAMPSAILLGWMPPLIRTPPAMSAELKTFLSKRSDRKSNAVPAIIVIRHGTG